MIVHRNMVFTSIYTKRASVVVYQCLSVIFSDHHFKVCVGNIYSDPYSQEASVSHGKILSVTLFSLKINSIVTCLLPDIKCSLYVDSESILNGTINAN